MRDTSATIVSSFVVAAGLLAGLGGCDDSQQAGTDRPPTPSAPSALAAALPEGLMLADAPAGVRAVADVKKEAKDGDEVVVRGRIGGQAEPFVKGRASFQLVDLGIKSCAEMPDEQCPTPWDYCCATDTAANSVNVQVLGDDGKPLKLDLNGVGGLKPLSEVAVKGTVRKQGDSAAVIVNATGLYVKG